MENLKNKLSNTFLVNINDKDKFYILNRSPFLFGLTLEQAVEKLKTKSSDIKQLTFEEEFNYYKNDINYAVPHKFDTEEEEFRYQLRSKLSTDSDVDLATYELWYNAICQGKEVSFI